MHYEPVYFSNQFLCRISEKKITMIIFLCFILLNNFQSLLTFYTTIETSHPSSDFRKIVTDSARNVMYVGGKNIVIKLNSDFQKTAEFVFGPKKSSKFCSPSEIKTCPNVTLQDNVVELLEYVPAVNKTIVCGSLEYGHCGFFNGTEIEHLSYKEANYFGSDQGSIFIPIHRVNSWVYMVGTAWDGRLNNVQDEFSFKKLEGSEFSYESHFSHLGFCSEKRSHSRLKFVYGFQDGNEFVYMVYLKVRKDKVRNYFETKIARICQNDDYLGSFNELKLSCDGHNIATAAYFSNRAYLYVAFGIGNQSLEARPSSVVCKYSLQNIKRQFENSIILCYSNINKDGYTPPRWSSCSSETKCHTAQSVSVGSICNTSNMYQLQGVEATDSMTPNSTVIFKMDKTTATSLLPQKLQGHVDDIVWVGSSDGFLYKVNSQPSNRFIVYAKYDLSKNRNVRIEPDVEIDSRAQIAYFLYGNKVSRFPLTSCRIHTTCGACVLNRDPLGCGWCRDKCLKREECISTWYNNSCPPFIEKVTPHDGPTAGGTIIKLVGENFGQTNLSSPIVTIGSIVCENITWNDTNIWCTSPPVDEVSYVGQVVVETASQISTYGYNVYGKSEIDIHNFTYKVPVVYSISPTFGPRHGNTIVTITGNNLDVGSNTYVSMCSLLSKNSTSIICKTNECVEIRSGDKGFQHSKPCPYCHQFKLTIDNFRTEVGNEPFCYRPDPDIKDISRKNTIKCGGLNFKIVGYHFDSVSTYVLRTIINSSVSQDTFCTQLNGTEIICKTPDLSNTSKKNFVEVLVLFDHDDFYWKEQHRHKPFHIRVFEDPFIETLDTSLSSDVLQDKRFLELKGSNLQSLKPEDILITLDEMDCPVIYIDSSMLRCDLSVTMDKTKSTVTNLSFDVEVLIGNLRMSLGRLSIIHQERLNLTGHKTLIPSVLILFFLILLSIGIICMRKNRIGPFKRRIIHHESSVVFHADSAGQQVSRRLMPDPDPESSTSARLNDYVRDFDGNLLDHVPYGVNHSDFADTVHVLEKQNLLIDGDFLRFDRNCSNLGRGNFGCVYKAFLKKPGENFEITVAVKTIIRSSDADVTAFLNEALIMKDFNHPNVLTLIGITLDKGEFPMVILPFMQNGSLLSYIRNENNMPTVKHLVSYGLHIARGMEYMADNKFVHRDLAARNCMLDVNFTVKVADFGLTRDVYSKEYYSSENKQRLPVKWMAPESLEQGKYSAKSDVWSYGVLLWELMTRGAIPYPEVDNWDVGAYIKSGRRLPRPEYCQPYLYRLMRFCWQENPDKRPTFNRLREEIERMLNIKNDSKMAGDTHVELDRCTNYHYMDEMSLARQRSLSTKWSTSSEDAALL